MYKRRDIRRNYRLRKKSKTYMKWEGFRLNENRRQILIVPAGCAHAFQTHNNAEVLYFCSQFIIPKKSLYYE